MTSKVIGRGFVLALLAVFSFQFAGCATTQFGGYISASDEEVKVAEKGNYVESAVAQIVIYQNPDFNNGKISPKALDKIQRYSISCQRQIEAQLAGPGQSGVNGAVPYGTAGMGTGGAAVAAFQGVSGVAYLTYGGLAYLLPGAVNGLVTGSYAMASAKGTCTRDFWEDIAKMDPDFRGTHVSVAYAGKRWGGSVPPALVQKAVVPVSAKPVSANPGVSAPPANPNQKAINPTVPHS